MIRGLLNYWEGELEDLLAYLAKPFESELPFKRHTKVVFATKDPKVWIYMPASSLESSARMIQALGLQEVARQTSYKCRPLCLVE